MKYSREQAISTLVSQFIDKGWRYQPGKKHGKLIAPWGRKLAIPNTPSDRRAFLNLRSRLRQLEAAPC